MMYFTKMLALGVALLSQNMVDAIIYSLVLPPSYPLVVRNPYVSAWMPGNQVANLPTATPQFWKGNSLSLGIMARVDGTVYKLFGVPATISGSIAATVISAQYTATHSIFMLTAGTATFTLDFFSPVSPKNYIRQSLPFSYLTVSVSRSSSSNIQIYSDIDESWTGQTGKTANNYQTYGNTTVMQLSVTNAIDYAQTGNEQGLMGQVVFASNPSTASTLTYQSGHMASVRAQFVGQGLLSNSAPAFVSGDVIALSHNLGTSTSKASVTFAIGYVREKAINYLGNARTHYYRATYPSRIGSVSHFLDDYASAYAEATTLDAALVSKATTSAGSNYSDILILTPRQVYGGCDLTIPYDTLNTTDIMVFMKEISSDGNANTLDVIYPAFPIFYVMSPDYIRFLLEPVMQYIASGRWPQSFAIHDIGTNYPNATGHDDLVEEDMPLEESGNLIQLIYAYTLATKNIVFATKYQIILQKYADYLASNSLNESLQLGTVDCCGALRNQTSLAIKSAIGLTAYGEMFSASNYTALGIQLANDIYTSGLAVDSAKTHFMLQYGPDVLHGGDASYLVAFNMYTDKLLALNTFPASAFEMQAAYYPTIRGDTGVPIESRVDWSSTFWTNWAAASSPAAYNSTRDMFINDAWAFMTNKMNNPPFSDRWFCKPGSGGLVGRTGDVIGAYNMWRNRPVQGGLFAVLALGGSAQV